MISLAQQDSMSFFQFQSQFATDDDCHDHLFSMKWPNGFHCPKCDSNRFYKISTRKLPLYECCDCRHQTSVTAGTIFEKTRTPLKKWFWAIYLVSNDKRGVSAAFLSRELEVCYTTAWTMLHKIRKAMSDRDAQYDLTGIIEIDDAYLGSSRSGGKRGRGTTKPKFIMGLSLSPKGHIKHVRIQSIPDVKGSTVTDFVRDNVSKDDSFLISDGFKSYKPLEREGFYHIGMPFNLEHNPEHLKNLHIVIGNLKALIGGTFHGLGRKHLDAYLSEFCYRFNRRGFGKQLFNRLVNACLLTDVVTYPELVG